MRKREIKYALLGGLIGGGVPLIILLFAALVHYLNITGIFARGFIYVFYYFRVYWGYFPNLLVAFLPPIIIGMIVGWLIERKKYFSKR